MKVFINSTNIVSKQTHTDGTVYIHTPIIGADRAASLHPHIWVGLSTEILKTVCVAQHPLTDEAPEQIRYHGNMVNPQGVNVYKPTWDVRRTRAVTKRRLNTHSKNTDPGTTYSKLIHKSSMT